MGKEPKGNQSESLFGLGQKNKPRPASLDIFALLLQVSWEARAWHVEMLHFFLREW